MDTLGKRLQNLREERGWSQREAANKLGLQQQSLQRYETDKILPGSEKLKDIVELFNCSADYLLGLTDEKEKMCEKDMYALQELKKQTNKKIDLQEVMRFQRPTYKGVELNNMQIEFLNDMLESIHRLGKPK
jgi:transcriptional regulator with XRE-family HTH domain